MISLSEYARIRCLLEVMNKMPEEESAALLRLILHEDGQHRTHRLQNRKLDKLLEHNKNSFVKEVSANVVGDALWDSMLFVARRLIR